MDVTGGPFKPVFGLSGDVDESRRIFESALERVRRSYRLYVYGYVVMPEHVHLLLSEPQQDTLADALKSLKQGVSRRLIGDAEHFWQKRYYKESNVWCLGSSWSPLRAWLVHCLRSTSIDEF